MAADILTRLVAGQHLGEEEARAVMEEIMTGTWPEARIAGFLTALRIKGETADEVVGFARVMREQARSFWEEETPFDVVDTCGTGGDGAGTFNISTTAAFVAAGAGARVAKHGNRAATSRAGAADVLEALGVEIDLPSGPARQALREIGIVFLFAPAFHRSMRHVMPARKALGIRTVFNVLGPLANPAGARSQVVGVFAPDLLELIGAALERLGVRRAFVVHGAGGLDEISLSGVTDVVEVAEGRRRRFQLRPEDLGLAPAPLDALRGGDAAENAAIVRAVLAGEPGPRRDAVLLNAGAAITAAGLAADLKEGVSLAAAAIDTGRALEKLERLRAFRP